GRLDREKNVIALLEIIKESDLNSIWKFQIIGDGPERKNLEDYVHQNDLEERTVFFGNQPIDEVVKLLQKSKIFVFTSLKEALPTVLIEAMMTGNAIIAYDCNYGPSDIINENNGFLIPLHDKKMFIEKLEYLTHNPEVLNDLMKSSFEESKKWKKEKPIEQWKSLLNSN
ncbi:MAG TPA: glycosyltransferase, partial [Moheibacter sp.]|nr:glycosyltransferase [Moheibacter sp.]